MNFGIIVFACIIAPLWGIATGPVAPGPVIPINPCIFTICPTGQYCTTSRCVPNCAVPPPVPPVNCGSITCPPCLSQCVMANSPTCGGWFCKQGPVCTFAGSQTCAGYSCPANKVCRMVYLNGNCFPQPTCVPFLIIANPEGPISKVTDPHPIPIEIPDPAGPVEQGGK